MLAHADTWTVGTGGSDGTARSLFFFVVFVNGDGFEILGFEDLAAIEAFNIVHAVASSDDLGAGVLTGLHKDRYGVYFNDGGALVKGDFHVDHQ